MNRQNVSLVSSVVSLLAIVVIGLVLFIGQPWDQSDRQLSEQQVRIVDGMAATAQSAVADANEASQEVQAALQDAQEIVSVYREELRQLRAERESLLEDAGKTYEELVELQQELVAAQARLEVAERALDQLGFTPEPSVSTPVAESTPQPEVDEDTAVEATPEGEATEPSEGDGLRGEGIRIAIVEDNSACSGILGLGSTCSEELVAVFNRELPGAEVSLFESCNQGFLGSQFDVIIMDYVIENGGPQGPECTEQYLDRYPGKILIGYFGDPARDRAAPMERAGAATSIVSKPDPEEVVNRTVNLLQANGQME